MTARKNVKHGTNTMTNLDILTEENAHFYRCQSQDLQKSTVLKIKFCISGAMITMPFFFFLLCEFSKVVPS